MDANHGWGFAFVVPDILRFAEKTASCNPSDRIAAPLLRFSEAYIMDIYPGEKPGLNVKPVRNIGRQVRDK